MLRPLRPLAFVAPGALLARTRPVALAAVAAPALATSAGCWDGWRSIFDQTPSREHRVEDLRVLAIEAEPASLLVPASFALDGPGAPGAPEALTVDARAFVFDPRGGEIAWSMRVCVRRAGTFVEEPVCEVPGPRAPGTLTTSADDPLGVVELPLPLAFDRDTLRGLYDAVGLPLTSLSGVTLDVQLDVVRPDAVRPERERAVLHLDARFDVLDPALDPAVRDALLEEAGAALCEDPLQCTPQTAVPECGNGVIEPGEQCDPPSAETGCEEGCFTLEFDFCDERPFVVCVHDVGENARPEIVGAIVSDTQALPLDPRTPTVEEGGVIAITPGESVFVFPATTEDFDTAVHQPPRFIDPLCPADSPGAQGGLECPFAENRSYRVYIADGRAELTYPVDPVTQAYNGNQFNQAEGVGVTFTADTPSGTREPLVLVAVDGHGGMDIAFFTLEAR